MRRALAILLATLIAFPPLTIATAAPAYASIAEEKKLGDEFLDEAIAKMPLIHDYELAGYLTDMGNKLVATLGPQPFDYEFFVVRDGDINAFSVPGGKLFANAGLIFRVDSDDALAGVIGHEVAHAAAHHLVRQQQKGAAAGYASLLGLLLGIINPGLAVASLAAGQAMQLSYQRDFEREADYLGIGYARKAGYDPSAEMALLRKINDDQALNPTKIPPYFLSHPLSSERLTNLEAVLGRHEWDPVRVKPSLKLKRAQAIARAYSQSREQCVPLYERAVATASPADKPEALELYGILLSHGEEYGTAEKVLREAEAAGRNVDRELGRTAFRRGNFVEARERLGRVIARTPGDWDTLADLAAMDTQEGNYAAAAEKLEKSVAGEHYRSDVLRALGRALGKSSREGEGFYWFGRASEVDGQSHQAIEYFRKSLAALPKTDAKSDPKTVARLDKIRQDIFKRSERLGDALHEEAAEARRQGQHTTPDGTPINPAPHSPQH